MKPVRLFIIVVILLNLVSCSITEKMILNENGSGKFSYEIDGSKMISFMGGAMKNLVEEDSKKEKKKKKKNKEKEGLLFEKESKSIDTTFTFKEIFASKQDSISKLPLEEQAKIKKMERFSVRTIVNQEKEILNYSMFTDFASVIELQDMMSPMESMKSLSPGGQNAGALGAASDALKDNSATEFFYDGKVFRKMVSKKVNSKDELQADNGGENADALKMKESLEMLYSQSNFKIVYQFPKAVKKVSIENALYSDDRKTITIEYPFEEYMSDPSKLNFAVEFQ